MIEFPVVLVDAAKEVVIGEFHSYVRPTENTTLTPFCRELTGIDQATVDAAPTLPEVLKHFDDWLERRDLVNPAGKTFALVTDGWDLDHFLDKECKRKAIPKASYLDQWIDLSITYEERRSQERSSRASKQKQHVVLPKKRTSLKRMLRHYGMQFKGRLHSGIDDARNIARLAIKMLKESDEPLCINDSLNIPHPDTPPSLDTSPPSLSTTTPLASGTTTTKKYHKVTATLEQPADAPPSSS